MKLFFTWLPLAVITTLLSSLIYTASQQILRQSANDPQIQMVEDAANALSNGADPSAVVSAQTVDISQSLAPYLIVFDETGKPLASSGQLNSKIPTLPQGVLNYAKNYGQNRITWQPQPNTRSAIVVQYYPGTEQRGFVMAGRSLRETEKRESQLTWNIFIGWLVTLMTSFIFIIVSLKTTKKSTSMGLSPV